MEIKKGDKIKLKKFVIYNSHCIDELTIIMLSNRILTVSEVYIDSIKILEDENDYYWFFDMFDKVCDKDHNKPICEEIKKEIKTKENEIKYINGEIQALKDVLDILN